jgi:hypothetical protein
MDSDVQYVGTALSIILGGRGKENREEFYRFPHPPPPSQLELLYIPIPVTE